FTRLSTYIDQELGIQITPSKKTMLCGRLAKRLRVLDLGSVTEYCDYLFSSAGQSQERVELFDAITTNKTDFYRESAHFDHLTAAVLPAWRQSRHAGRAFRIWSAGCSSGEEPYTMAMVLSEYAQKCRPANFDFEIIATDISTRVLDYAKTAIYHVDRIAPVPAGIRTKYLLRSKEKNSPLVRIAPPLRRSVRFGRLNFMDAEFKLPFTMDVIFCRNVIIYFDSDTREQLMHKFCRHLHPGGHLFLGHSESLHGFDLPLRQVASTVYERI
ncbi:MAG: methyltransferase domain-containing protein, partial [Desulfuromonas sp.]|nr:methyltransferase domain-containing protein [Desulfuromonas sp.]